MVILTACKYYAIPVLILTMLPMKVARYMSQHSLEKLRLSSCCLNMVGHMRLFEGFQFEATIFDVICVTEFK